MFTPDLTPVLVTFCWPPNRKSWPVKVSVMFHCPTYAVTQVKLL